MRACAERSRRYEAKLVEAEAAGIHRARRVGFAFATVNASVFYGEGEGPHTPGARARPDRHRHHSLRLAPSATRARTHTPSHAAALTRGR